MTSDEAKSQLDERVREMMAWHFSDETGCPFWLDWKKESGWDPREEVKGYDDIVKFPHFQDEWLRDEKNERFVPNAYKGRPFNVFETGGTTGLPKQRVGWEDYSSRISSAMSIFRKAETGSWWGRPAPGVCDWL